LRYYTILILDGGREMRSYTSFPGGKNDLGALDVELDLPVTVLSTPIGGGHVSIYGVSLQEISQSSDYNGKQIKVYGGMQAGLPLADPSQSGLLVAGTIYQAFGNWIGTDQTINFFIGPDAGSNDTPKNLVLNWKAGTNLADALTSTLKTAYPGYTVTANIKDNLIQTFDEPSYHSTLGQLADYVSSRTQAMIGGSYTGVKIVLKDKEFLVYDGTSPTDPKQIKFTDLIGQPTYRGPFTISVTLVMRADIFVGDHIKLPKTLLTNTSAALSQYRDTSVFQGIFQVLSIRHVGRFRQPDGNSWVTIVEATGDGSGR